MCLGGEERCTISICSITRWSFAAMTDPWSCHEALDQRVHPTPKRRGRREVAFEPVDGKQKDFGQLLCPHDGLDEFQQPLALRGLAPRLVVAGQKRQTEVFAY